MWARDGGPGPRGASEQATFTHAAFRMRRVDLYAIDATRDGASTRLPLSLTTVQATTLMKWSRAIWTRGCRPSRAAGPCKMAREAERELRAWRYGGSDDNGSNDDDEPEETRRPTRQPSYRPTYQPTAAGPTPRPPTPRPRP